MTDNVLKLIVVYDETEWSRFELEIELSRCKIPIKEEIIIEGEKTQKTEEQPETANKSKTRRHVFRRHNSVRQLVDRLNEFVLEKTQENSTEEKKESLR